MLDVTIALLLTTLAFAGLLANVLGMPGNWLIVAMAAACLGLAPDDRLSHVGWAPFIAIVLVAAFGELLEFAASALGASRMGGSKRGTVLAIFGSIGGAIAGLFCGTIIPIPIVGPVIGSLLLGGLEQARKVKAVCVLVRACAYGG